MRTHSYRAWPSYNERKGICEKFKTEAVFSINTGLMAMLRHEEHICMLLFLTTGRQSATNALLQLKRRLSTTERHIINFMHSFVHSWMHRQALLLISLFLYSLCPALHFKELQWDKGHLWYSWLEGLWFRWPGTALFCGTNCKCSLQFPEIINM